MSINVIQASAGTLSESREGTKLAADFDGFLKLLTAQLQTQDPLSPMDAEQFTSQLVQFSAVEQAIQTNSQLGNLVGLMQTTQHTAALQYVGATVELDNARTYLPSGGEATIAYELAQPAAQVTVSIIDTAGKTIRELVGPAGIGPQTMRWDGVDADRRGRPAGAYGVRVEAVDAAGRPVAASLETTGRVDALLQSESGLVLSVDGRAYPLDAVRAVLPAA